MNVTLGTNLQLFCNITGGAPGPEINWYKNGVLITRDNRRIEFSPDMKTLTVNNSTTNDSGEFKCIGENRFWAVGKVFNLGIIELATTSTERPETEHTTGYTLSENPKSQNYDITQRGIIIATTILLLVVTLISAISISSCIRLIRKKRDKRVRTWLRR